jgi:hypothetical protein
MSWVAVATAAAGGSHVPTIQAAPAASDSITLRPAASIQRPRPIWRFWWVLVLAGLALTARDIGRALRSAPSAPLGESVEEAAK